ncbi:hypothetical protein C0991_000794 [Blastosporella zonata]|nr:hypothetical protein C0991_000794 [Blastosporella zonata]
MRQTRKTQSRRAQESEPSKQSSIKQPLQDITDRFVPLPVRHSRKPAAPSSLPPSSPPSAHTFSELSINRITYDARHTDNLPDTIDAGDSTHSDPFGFFAVENKLKSLRTQQDKPRASRPPRIQTTRSNLVSPPTPPKRRNKRRVNMSPDSEADSMPSSPSPRKPILIKGKERALSGDGHAVEGEAKYENVETITLIPRLDLRRRATKRACNSTTKLSGRSSSPEQTGLLAQDSRRSEIADVKKPRVTASTARSSMRQKRPGQRKAKPPSTADHDLKKWEQERQARLEYFKKLESYQVEKENIYVV